MIIRAVDTLNDWTFGKGLANYAQDETAILQNVKSRVLSWQGDCFFAVQDGVDWKSRLSGKPTAALAQEVRGVILQSFGVVGVDSVDVDFSSATRDVQITFQGLTTIFSESFLNTIQQGAGE